MSNPDLNPVASNTTNTEITPLQKIGDFHKLIDDTSTAMLVTRSESGALHSRAMTPCRRTPPSYSAVDRDLIVQQQSCRPNSTCSSSQTMRPTSSTRSNTTPMSMCLSMTRRLPDGQASRASRKSPKTRTWSRSFGLQCSSMVPVRYPAPSLIVQIGSRLSSAI